MVQTWRKWNKQSHSQRKQSTGATQGWSRFWSLQVHCGQWTYSIWEKLIKITQISKSMRSVYFDKKKFYIRSAFSFAFAHYHCFRCIRSKSQILLWSTRQSNLFTLYISFDSLTFNTCGYFSRPMGVWKKYILMLNHRVRDLLFFHLRTICPLSFRHTSYGLIWAFHLHFSPL